MKVDMLKWKMTDSDFGPLLPFIQDNNITDIDYNGENVWVTHLQKGRYLTSLVLDNGFIERFTSWISDAVSQNFSQYNPLLEAETDTLRISIIHEEHAHSGRSISIRKTPKIKRLNREKMISENYCSAEVMDLIENCVKAKMNILICGTPGVGKTELLKYLTTFIPANERVITIEDNLEIHYSDINPGKDCVELKVSTAEGEKNRFSYIIAIKACLRQNPQWILLSEARSTEVKYLMESMSTGTHCLTTIHTDDVRKVPDRIKNMVEDSVIAARIENDVFTFLDAAILVNRHISPDGIRRYIEQMCFFVRDNGNNDIIMVVDEEKVIERALPEQITKKFKRAGISNLYDTPIRTNEDVPVKHTQDSDISSPSSSNEDEKTSNTVSSTTSFDHSTENWKTEKNVIEMTYAQHKKDDFMRNKRKHKNS